MNLLSGWEALKPYIITYGGPEIALVLMSITLMPVVYLWAIAPSVKTTKRRVPIMLALWSVLAVCTYWETFAIALQAKMLCETEAGIKVFRTVEAEGFLGTTDIEFWARRGFRYVESRGAGRQMFRRTMEPVGGKARPQIRRTEVENFLSKYEFSLQEASFPPCCSAFNIVVRVIDTGEVLGKASNIRIHRSSLDRLIPVERSAPGCTGPGHITRNNLIFSDDLVALVIKPLRDVNGAP